MGAWRTCGDERVELETIFDYPIKTKPSRLRHFFILLDEVYIEMNESEAWVNQRDVNRNWPQAIEIAVTLIMKYGRLIMLHKFIDTRSEA